MARRKAVLKTNGLVYAPIPYPGTYCQCQDQFLNSNSSSPRLGVWKVCREGKKEKDLVERGRIAYC
jgi:hypothetical protein